MHRLYRHPTDKVIGGVAAGLAAWMNVDPTIVRIAWVVLALFTGGLFLVLYIVMLFVVPLPPADAIHGGPGQGGWTGPVPPGASAQLPSPTAPGTSPTPGWGAVTPTSPSGWAPPSIGNGNAGIVAGVILVLLGAWFLLDQYVDIDWSLLWPVLVMLAGVALIVVATRRSPRAG